METTYIKNARILTEDGVIPGALLCRNGVIEAVGSVPQPVDAEAVDAGGALLAPGFLDLHTHGAVNVDVNDADPEGLVRISRFFASHGVTGWLCSILTDTQEQTLRCIAAAKEAMQDTSGARLLGIHLEGPSLSPQYAGAMPQHLLRNGDAALIHRYQEAADGAIRTMTIAPELPGALDAIRELSGEMILSLGHSNATYDQAIAAIDAGARCITHTFNAMRLFHQHEPAIMGAVLESDVYCEAICDGRHLHPGSVRFLLKMKGYDRVIAITDSIMAAGLPDGNYKLGVNDVIVEEGDAKLKDGTRAGSTLTTGQAFRNLMKFTGESPEKILPLLTENPATMLGLQNSIGFIGEGKDADVLIMDSEFQIKETFVKGRRII